MPDQIRIAVRQISPTTSEAAIREHRVLFDRPVEKGGADAGPMGGEVFLASVAGCFLSNLLAAIRARDTAVSEVRVEVTGTLEGPPSRFAAIDLAVTATGADRETMEKLTEVAARGCILVNTLRDKLNFSIHLA
jgi:putative redox protein